ncbi:MAG TPA: DUF1080 domain-containing protein [Chthonomonadales bacterium]|nr:DUF1080 domain-containing protein [Chthonomonadales bacterium]
MVVRALALVGILAAVASLASAQRFPEGRWVPLFNGRNLDGWTPKIRGLPLGQDPRRTFRVENGLLRVSYDGYQQFDNQFGHLFFRRPFSHYILRVEYRFVGQQVAGGPGWAFRNSGAMLHCQPPATMRVDQEFPVSIEAQLLGGDGTNPRTTNNLCTPGTIVVMDGRPVAEHCTNSRSRTFHGDQWVTAEMEVRGSGRIIHRVNGEVVMEYEQPQLDPADGDAARLIRNGVRLIDNGYIALQAESHPIEFRRVEIQVLPRR